MAKKNRDPEQPSSESAAATGAAVIDPPQYGDDAGLAESANVVKAGKPAKPATVAAEAVRTVMIEVPVCKSPEERYATRSLRPLSFGHARILRDVADALAAEGAIRENGSPVRNSDDAMVWLLERVNSARASSH